MEGTGYEVGVKGSQFDGKLNSSIALFKIEQENLAIWINTPGGNTYRSEQGTTTKGAEFTLDGELRPSPAIACRGFWTSSPLAAV